MNAIPRKSPAEFTDIEIGSDERVYTTGVVCKVVGIPVWTLKQLDAEGIVSPPRETKGSTRLYSIRELKKVNYCWYFIKAHKVKVTGLKVILKIKEGTLEGL